MRALTIGLMAAAFAVTGCSEKTQDAAGTAASSAANDTAANLDQAGDSIANGADAVGDAAANTGDALANGAAVTEADVQGTTVEDAKRD